MPVAYHPELKRRAFLLRLLPSTTRRNLRMRRALMSRIPSRLRPGVVVHDDLVADGDSRVPIRSYRPEGSTGPLPTLVWLHGGGLVMGVHTDDMQCSRLADELGVAVVSVDYRLAPEHPYPAAIDDITAVVAWLAADGPDHGLDASRLAVGGQSAGGGLAAATAQHLHDRAATVELRGQLLIYPMLDDRTVTRPGIDPKGHLVWDNRSNETGWSSYLGVAAGSEQVPPHAVPARRDDLSGLPPAWIGIGTLDLFHDECVDYAERLVAAGVDCELRVVDGMVHGFDMLVPRGEATRAFNDAQDTFLRRVLELDG